MPGELTIEQAFAGALAHACCLPLVRLEASQSFRRPFGLWSSFVTAAAEQWH